MWQHDHERESVRPRQRPRDAAGQGEDDVAVAGGPLSPSVILGLQRTTGNEAVQRMLAGREREGGVVQRSAVRQVLGSAGRPLDQPVRTEMEARLGTDFSDVRVHTDPTAQAAAESVQANAFTSGSHIVFQRGRYDPSSAAGKRMLAHELTHVVQQRSGPVAGTDTGDGLAVSDPSDRFERAAEANADRAMAAPVRHHGDHPAAERSPTAGPAVQRDVGFEVELPGSVSLAMSPPIKADERTGAKRIVTPITSQTWVERRAGRSWYQVQIDEPSMARRLAKKEVLVDVPGLFTLEAEDGSGGVSSLEFVSEHFPEGAAGRERFAAAIAEMLQVASLIDGDYRTAHELAAPVQGTGQVPTDIPQGQTAAEYVGLGIANIGNPQVTAGIPLANLEGLFAAVRNAYGARNDPDPHVAAGSRDLVHQDSIPDGAGGFTGAIRSAKQYVDQVLNQFAFEDEQEGEDLVEVPASDDLRGLLLMVAAYLINGAAIPNKEYAKAVAPVLARTDFAAMFALLDPAERARLTVEDGGPFVRLALRCANLTASAAGGPVLGTVTGDQPGQRVSLAEVTRQAWLRGITRGTDLLSRHGYAAQFPAQAAKGAHFESMGSLGAQTDTAQGRPAPIVELRRMGKDLPVTDWASVLLGVFDLITAIVEQQNNNPRYRRA